MQSATSNTGQWIARFNYGGATANTGTNVLTVAKDNSYFLNVNVGIGRDDPGYPLDIFKSSSTSGSATGTTVQRLWNYVGSDLSQQKTFIDFVFQDDNDNEYPQVRIGAEVGQNADANSTIKEGSGAFVVYTNNATGSTPGANSLTERMRVDYAGNVGIGTANPDYDLDVNGDIRARENIRVFGNSVSPPTYNTPTETSVNLGTYINDFAYIDLASTNAGGSWLDFSKANGTDYSGRIRYVNSSDQFQISTAGSQKMVVTSNGNVGIGTTSPLKLLTVKKATSTNTIATSEVMRLAGTAQVVGNKNELGFANYDNDFNASVVIGAEIMSTAAYLKQDLYLFSYHF